MCDASRFGNTRTSAGCIAPLSWSFINAACGSSATSACSSPSISISRYSLAMMSLARAVAAFIFMDDGLFILPWVE